MPALHLHHVRNGVDRPRHARRSGKCAPAGGLGLVVTLVPLEAEGVLTQHVRVQRIDVAPLRQHSRDALPQVAPLLPAERPEQAPPRVVAAKSDGAKSDADKSGTSKSDAGRHGDSKSNADEPEAAPKPRVAKPEPTKKRRQNRRS